LVLPSSGGLCLRLQSAYARFQDDTEHQRFKQVTPEGTTLYIAAFGVLAELSGPGTMSAKWTEYLSVGNAKVGMRTLQVASETLTTRYFHTDHLGSISVITNENGVVVERLSYDAWGKRRNADGSDDTSGSITSQTTRGFTGEEELSVSGLVHLNGRVYDPLLARMTSADPTVTDPMIPQGWNRYSYVGNDPLAFTDPNGFSWLSSFFHSVSHAISGAVHAVTNFFQTNAIARAILQIATTAALAFILGPYGALASLQLLGATVAAIAGAGGAMVATALSGGNLSQTLRAGVVAGITALAFYGVGSATNAFAGVSPDAPHITPGFDTPGAYAFNVAGHAAVGCLSSVASGGECGSGALAAAAGASVGPLMAGQSFATKLVVSSVAGGVGSVAGGGKFANGAITGAFGYLFNECGGACFRRAWGQAALMTLGWATGLGPSDRYFGPGTDQVNDLMDSPIVARARDYYYANKAEGESLTNYKGTFGIDGLIESGSSPTAQFVGSARVNIYSVASEDATYLQFVVTNTSSLKSFLYGQGPAYAFGPGSNTSQTYVWFEKTK
jgi:RHS repeat-associated protein